MEKQITFDGVALTPYNDISPDGQLSACCNLERHAGSLRPVSLQGSRYTKRDTGSRLVFVHNTAYYNHFIFYNASTGSLSWSEQTQSLSLVPLGAAEDVKRINAIGNTLIVTTGKEMLYFIYKEIEHGYKRLGTMPEVSLSFGLVGNHYRDVYPHTVELGTEWEPSPGVAGEFPDSIKTLITNSVMAEVSAFINEYSNDGYFLFPFLVRYALRLYDGTLTHHSAPVLMMCMNDNVNAIATYEYTPGRRISQFTFKVSGSVFKLDYICTSGASDLKDWADIIQSVDVFVSQPIYTFWPDKDCKNFYWTSGLADYWTICKADTYYQRATFVDMYELKYGLISAAPDGYKTAMILKTTKTKTEIDEAIEETSNFYLVKSMPLDSLATTQRTEVEIPKDIMNNLTFQERMTDDYQSHDAIYGQFTTTYNQRLILSNVNRKYFDGFKLESAIAYNNSADAKKYKCYVYIMEEGREIIVESVSDYPLITDNIFYFYYPNVNAYKVVINSPDDLTGSIVLALKPHPLLNGAYYYSEGLVSPVKSAYVQVQASPEEERQIRLANKIYTSEVGNPFKFPVNGINTVGVGEIIGTSTVTVALSQGQFGSFPLMAFCTDGNYALQVNSEGLFSAVYPMQRDVCVNRESITQIDGAVVFVSSRGVMVADGSVINCISEILNGVFDNLDFVSGLADFSYAVPSEAPVDFFRECLIAYDYAGKRMMFFSKKTEDNTVWILSLEDNTWSQAEISGVTSVYNSYPYSYIELNGGLEILRLDEAYRYSSDEASSGLLVTRPLKLDTYQLKSLRQVSLVGSFSEAQTVGIYGSQDGAKWLYLGKSKAGRILTPGRYFKYYRFSVETTLSNSENISGLRIEYDIRPERRYR
mgnify:FL=1|jgi:hypothetical protein